MSAPNFDQLRRLMPVARQWAYFDHAAVAPLPEPTRQLIKEWADDTAEHGDAHWLDWARRVSAARHSGVRLLKARDDEVALVRNTTEGITLVAEGWPWREGDNVVTLADEFPSNQYPWMNLASRGVETRRVSLSGSGVDLRQLADACDERTRIVSISWVRYVDGWRNDLDALAELVHRRGALLFLDAIQGLGVFPLDVSQTPIDFLAADGHKWLLGPEGAGLFYVQREHLERLRPLGVGWNSVVQGDFSQIELNLKPSAARYEGGTYPMGSMIGLGASLDLLSAWDLQSIAERVVSVADELAERLRSAGATVHRAVDPQRRSGIVAFDWPGDEPAQARSRCLERGVALSARGGHVRASAHAYNNSDDIDRLLAALQSE